MAVYVDNARHAFRARRNFRAMIMCHMVGDSLAELHSMAARIGVRRRWFQDRGKYYHYDICRSKRALAIAAGAIEVGSREIIAVACRAQGLAMPGSVARLGTGEAELAIGDKK